MKKVTDIYKNTDLENKLLINLDKKLKDKEFKEFIDSLNTPYEVLAKYTSVLEDSSVEYHNCKNCKNILECKNKMQGYAYLPHIKNKKIDFEYQMCNYLKKIEEENKYLKNVYTFNEPNEIIHANIENIYMEDKKRSEVIKYLAKFINDYIKNKNPKGLYLNGSFGSGKTYLISATLNELAKKGYKSAIVFWPEYLRLLKASFNNNDEYKNNFNKIKEAPILLIDDIGAETTTAWSRDEVLCTILQYRMEKNLCTFITSNLDLNALEKHLSNSKDGVEEIKAKRIIERVKQLTNNMEMISKNLRK